MALFDDEKQTVPSNLLTDRFIVPPFTVFDTKQGYWQQRKKYWIDLGIKSELGREQREDDDGKRYNHTTKDGRKQPQMTFTRGGQLMNAPDGGVNKFGRKPQQTSIFDPVLCEIAVKWFTQDNDTILDPFAGGSVRGIVSGALKRQYVGVDLSAEQIDMNNQQFVDVSNDFDGIVKPTWINGDSMNIKELVQNQKFNFVFSCPPYYNLEVYSTLEGDLSYKRTYNEFLESYRSIIKDCCELLIDDSFAVFVVGNLRNDTDGGYYDFVGDTIRAFTDCGLLFYNDCIIVNTAGTLPIRAPLHFNQSRKVERQHQNFLVFYKGNPKNIKDKFGFYEQEFKEGQ